MRRVLISAVGSCFGGLVLDLVGSGASTADDAGLRESMRLATGPP